jgi:acyl-CoA dehydrogenase
MERAQGRTPGRADGAIIGHADVRRMLLKMKAEIESARAICAVLRAEPSTWRRPPRGEEARWAARAAFLTPIAKAFGTDVGIDCRRSSASRSTAAWAIVEATGAAQFLRDVRVTAIYEGTNGIQAMDLVGRKLMDGGELVEQDMEPRFAGAVPYQHAFARVLGGHFHLRAALAGDASRQALARFYLRCLLPEHAGLLVQVRDGADAVLALTPADLAA